MGMIGNTLAQGLISGANIQDGTVDTPDIKSNAITPSKLSIGAPTWDAGGNQGVGATPSAWGAGAYGFRAVDIGNYGALASWVTDTRKFVGLYSNLYLNSSSATVYKANGPAASYRMFEGAHYWTVSPTGTAGATTSPADALTLDSGGNFLIGGTTLATKLTVSGAGFFTGSTYANAGGAGAFIGGDGTNGLLYGRNNGAWAPVYIDGASLFLNPQSGGNVGINTASPAVKLHVVGPSNGSAIRAGNSTVFTDWGTDATGTYFENTGTSAATRAVRIQAQDGANAYSQVIISGGNQYIAFTNNSIECAKVERYGMNGGWGRVLTLSHTFPVHVWNSNGSKWAGIGYDYSVTRGLAFWTDATSANVTSVSPLMQMGGGSVAINGSLSKSSGSFRIDHPLPQLAETHDLVHSFVEAPQADNLYRGKVTLVDGTAAVNIDSAAGMTDGTFVLLNREIQCFTTNETGWTNVRGSVNGNTLTIQAQDTTCTDTISWMVIGERQDKHMYDTEWTDDEGKVIVEPLKEVRLEPAVEEGAPE